MATAASHNKNSAAVRRIMSEAKELRNDDSTEYSAAPLENDIFEWHCTIRGPADTEFEGGLYHCRISLPFEYPFKAPSVMVLTPNGRFELNKKICISFTSYHEELWQPAWGVRTVIVGLQGFFPLKGEAAVGVGAVEYPIAERKRLATLSRSWTCPDCGVCNLELLPDPPKAESSGMAETSTSESPKGEAAADPPLPSSLDTVPAVDSVTSQISTFNPTDAAGAGLVESAPGEVLKSAALLNTILDRAQGDIQAIAAPPSDSPEPPSVPEIVVQPAPTPAPQPEVRTPPRPQGPEPRMRVDVMGRSRARAPLWLDASIAFFAVLIAYMAGRRLTHIWEVVTEYVY